MACGSFPQYPQDGEICEEGEKGSVDVLGSGCGGSGSLVEVWEEPSGKNGLNSTSPELGNTGARGGPGWMVPAAAGCACCERAGRQCGLERTAGSARKPCLTPLLRHFPSSTQHTWAEMGEGGSLHPSRIRGQTETGKRLERGLGLRSHVISSERLTWKTLGSSSNR